MKSKPQLAFCYRSGEIHIARTVPRGGRWLLLEGDPLTLLNFLSATQVRVDGVMLIPAVRDAETDIEAEEAALLWIKNHIPAATRAGLLPRATEANIKRLIPWARRRTTNAETQSR